MSLQGIILGSSGSPKSAENLTYEHRRALWPSKNGVWKRVRKKHENSMKNLCENRSFLMAQNHVWRYTLRLFHTFGLFEKSRKIDAKMEPKSRGFWSKMRPWAPNGRLILPFSTIFENSKNRWFFDVAFRRRKINKNWPVGVKGLPQGLRVSSGGTRFRRQCPQGGSRARIISR